MVAVYVFLHTLRLSNTLVKFSSRSCSRYSEEYSPSHSSRDWWCKALLGPHFCLLLDKFFSWQAAVNMQAGVAIVDIWYRSNPLLGSSSEEQLVCTSSLVEYVHLERLYYNEGLLLPVLSVCFNMIWLNIWKTTTSSRAFIFLSGEFATSRMYHAIIPLLSKTIFKIWSLCQSKMLAQASILTTSQINVLIT